MAALLAEKYDFCNLENFLFWSRKTFLLTQQYFNEKIFLTDSPSELETGKSVFGI